MTSKRMHFVLIGLVGLLVVGLVGGAYGVNVLLGKQSKQLVNLKAQDQTLNQQQIGLVKAKKEIATYSELEKITKQIVPQDKDQAESVREIVNIAGQNGITLSTINFPASTLGSSTVPSAGASSSATAGGTSPSAAISAKPSLSQLITVPGILGVYQLQITLQDNADSPVSYDKLYNFLTALENNRRTAQVSSVVIQPVSTNRNLLTFTLTLNEYIKPS